MYRIVKNNLDSAYYFTASYQKKNIPTHQTLRKSYQQIYVPDYDETQTDNYLLYVDGNNSYGWALSEYLTYGGFEWFESHRVELWKELIRGDDAESEIGYIWATLNQYTTSVEAYRLHHDITTETVHKLLAKKDYVLQAQNFQYYINNGMEPVRVNWVIGFHQKPFMKISYRFQYSETGTE